MSDRWLSLSAAVVAAAVVWLGLLAGGASAAVTPGWECIPATAGKAVLSGGTGSAPSCGAGTTAVLAPTFVSSGVGGKPTVRFAAVNVQILSGSGATKGPVNGLGNLVLGYDESPGTQTGSHDLVRGTGQTYTSYASILGGSQNRANAANTVAFGSGNIAKAQFATVTGGRAGTASGSYSSISGGYGNLASTSYTSVSGGCSNLAGSGGVSIASICTDTTGFPNSFATITGGTGNQASATAAAVSGGRSNLASGFGARSAAARTTRPRATGPRSPAAS
jgi:hypothetical protein